MNFKDHIKADLSTFLSLNEFADEHIIDEITVTAILDSTVQQEHPLSYAEGAFLSMVTLYVAASELGYIPKQDQRLNVDGKRWTIVHVAEEEGLLTLRLEANDT